MEKCVIYARVSTKHQDDSSQFSDLKRYAKDNNYQISEIFGETVSGYDVTVERDIYEKMKTYVLQNGIKHILIWEISRLGRSALATLKQIEFFTEKGINIYFKKDNINTISENGLNKMLLSLLSSIAELERNTFIERSVRGRIHSAVNGKRTGYGILPYGYTSDENGFLKVNDVEAKIIQNIYDWSLSGESLKGIARKLNSLGVKTRTNIRGKKRKAIDDREIESTWRSNTISKILRNTLYKGVRVYSNIVINVPSIIDDDQWNAVQNRLDSNVSYLNNTKYNYLLRGKLRCGQCGLAYLSRTENRYKIPIAFYYCTGRRDQLIRCKNGQFKNSVLDKSVYDLLFKHGKFISTMDNENETEYKSDDKYNQIKFFEEELLKIEKKIINVKKLFSNADIEEDDFENLKRENLRNKLSIEKDIQKTHKEIALINSQKKGILNKIEDLAKTDNFEIKRQFIVDYVDKIVLYKVEKCEINFEELSIWNIGYEDKPLKQKVSKPHGNDTLMYIEIFAFNDSKPIKALVSNVTEINLKSDDLFYDHINKSINFVKQEPSNEIDHPITTNPDYKSEIKITDTFQDHNLSPFGEI